MSEDELARLLDTIRFEQATPAARAWCAHFLAGGARSATPRLDELAGELLSWQAPGRPIPPEPPDDDGR